MNLQQMASKNIYGQVIKAMKYRRDPKTGKTVTYYVWSFEVYAFRKTVQVVKVGESANSNAAYKAMDAAVEAERQAWIARRQKEINSIAFMTGMF